VQDAEVMKSDAKAMVKKNLII
jgi:hypothetical protein